MITEIDWQILMNKLNAIDERLNTLEKEVEELKFTPLGKGQQELLDRKEEIYFYGGAYSDAPAHIKPSCGEKEDDN